MTKPDSLSDGEGGTWTVEDCGEPEYLDGVRSQYTVRDAGGRPIAYAFEAEDARKLAAAPDLLEALKELDAVLGDTPMPDCATMNRLIAASSRARAAIAKAEAAS